MPTPPFSAGELFAQVGAERFAVHPRRGGAVALFRPALRLPYYTCAFWTACAARVGDSVHESFHDRVANPQRLAEPVVCAPKIAAGRLSQTSGTRRRWPCRDSVGQAGGGWKRPWLCAPSRRGPGPCVASRHIRRIDSPRYDRTVTHFGHACRACRHARRPR